MNIYRIEQRARRLVLVRKLYKREVTRAQMAARLNVTRRTIDRDLQDLGLCEEKRPTPLVRYISMPPALDQAVAKEARRTGMTAAALIRRAVTRFLEQGAD